MTQEEVLSLVRECGALLEGHFLLTSGLHSDRYFEKFTILQHPALTERLCRALAERFAADGVEVVVGPAVGGILLAHEVAKHLGTRALFTEREGGRMGLRRGFAVAPGEKVLIVEDVVTTGGSVQEVLDVVAEAGGEPVGVAYLVDRSGGRVDFGVRAEALLRLDVEAHSPENCPMCRDGVPLTARGSRYSKSDSPGA